MQAAGLTQLGGPVKLLELPGPGQGTISITVGGWYPLGQAGEALAQARRGAHGAAVIVRPATQDSAGP
jgi:hypothetical protein